MNGVSKILCTNLLIISIIAQSFGQGSEIVPTIDRSYKPMTLKVDDSGYKYIRFLMWNQFLLTGENNENGDFKITPGIKRFRFLTYAQFTPDFMILSHWGVNNLGVQNMDPVGSRSDGPQLFLHAAWIEYHLYGQALTVGAGLHYWNGPSRQSSASTLTFLTLDNYRQGWSKLGLTDQFARNLGMFVKGQYGRFTYNVSLDAPIVNSLDVSRIPAVGNGETLYTGRYTSEDASWMSQGYFKYDFFDVESCVLPYKVCSHLAQQHVLSIGAGYVAHPKGSITYQPDGTLQSNDVFQYAVDLFYDVPFARTALTTYLVYYYFDYGPNYSLGTTYGTGNSVFGNVGFLLPMIANRYQVQPYVAYSYRDFEAFEKRATTFQVGTNFYLNFHQAKLTFEYLNTRPNYSEIKPDNIEQWRLQMMVYM